MDIEMDIQRFVETEVPKPAEMAVVKHGHWIWQDMHNSAFYVKVCSVCGWSHELNSNYNYCPMCGAKMDEVEQDEQ